MYVKIDFVCRHGWAMVPKYLVNHYSGCFCEGGYFFWDEINIKIDGLCVKQIATYNMSGLHSISCKPE